MAVTAETIWTTGDELGFVRGMFLRQDRSGLKSYVALAAVRRWYGDGMRVDPGVVILEARDLLSELERQSAAC